MDDPIEKILASANSTLRENAYIFNSAYGEQCESPIEVSFLLAVMFYSLIEKDGYPAMSTNTDDKNRWCIETQKQIGAYRVDFLMSVKNIKTQIVVECDGHDFHERTKEQAERDRSRDRELTLSGYRVIRFTGREIWRDPWKCASEIDRQFYSIMHQESA